MGHYSGHRRCTNENIDMKQEQRSSYNSTSDDHNSTLREAGPCSYVISQWPQGLPTRRRTQVEFQVAECGEVMAGSRKKTRDQQLLDQTTTSMRALTPWMWIFSTSLVSEQLTVMNHFIDQKTAAQ